ncbi:oxidoreductase [Colwellia sp. C1TZA3]|uniref:oxidoreductase n=1 Tax=Colwellia sp. C1TZA3 TaxID=2508879 RepID=UPI0011B9CBF9|nr:oxidoreductase [Colwellia sp. C1TZA3]TWX72925.1 oxidoreductase [Colwellia sp. C1TZA3]
MIKVGVIGYGYSAKTFHIPLIETSEYMELVAINSSQKELVREQYPNIFIFDTAQALITNANLELIVITAPNGVHYSLAKFCLEHGINVVIEKPMVTTSVEAQELVDLAKEHALLLSVFHNRRWDGDFLTVKKLLQNNQLGDVRYFESHYDRFRPTVRQRWREQAGKGSGIWFDLGSHLVDQAINLFGLPEALTARCLPLRIGSETTDYFHVLLHYENLEVVLHASSFLAAPNMRFRIEGTKGSFIKYGFDPQEAQLKKGISPKNALYGVENEEEYGRLYTEFASTAIATQQGCYNQYYLEIVQAIKLAGANPVNPADVVEVLSILELAEISSESGKKMMISTSENYKPLKQDK